VNALDVDRMRTAAEDPSARFTYVVAGTKTAEERDTFGDLVYGLIPVFRGQPGARFYDVLEAGDPRGIASYESWATEQAENAHLATEPVQQFLAAVGPTLASPPAFRHYTNLAPLAPSPDEN
jgi:quinol monooxygenase YgiN